MPTAPHEKHNFEAFATHEDFVRRLARVLLRDRDAAEDIVQQAWIRTTLSPPRRIASLRPWLSQVVRSLVRESFRSQARRSRRELRAARPEAAPRRRDSLECAEMRRAIIDALRALPEPVRTVIISHHLHGRTVRDVAGDLGFPVETVRSQIKRGHRLLRAALRRDYGTESHAVLVALASTPRRLSLGNQVGPGSKKWRGIGRSLPSPSSGGRLAIAAKAAAWLCIGSLLIQLEFPFETGETGPPNRAQSSRFRSSPSSDTRPIETLSAQGKTDRSDVAEKAGLPPFLGTSRRGSTRIRGVVRSAEGGPVEGAVVYFGRPDRDRAFASAAEFGQEWWTLTQEGRLLEGERWTSTRTDKRGWFRSEELSFPTHWTVVAMHPNIGVAAAFWVSTAQRVSLVLEGGLTVQGRVLDDLGRPLSEAEVTLLGPAKLPSATSEFAEPSRRGLDGQSFVPWFVLRSGPGGKFAFPPAPSLTRGRLRVAAEGFLTEEWVLGPGLDRDDPSLRRTLRLVRAPVAVGEIHGDGVDLSSLETRLSKASQLYPPELGLAPLEIRVLPTPPRSSRRWNLPTGRRGSVELREGRYRLALGEPIHPGESVLLLAGANILAQGRVLPRGELPRLTVRHQTILALTRPRATSVEVIDAETGDPVPSYEILVAVEDRQYGTETLSRVEIHSLDGRGEVRLPPGDFLLGVEAPETRRSVQVVRVSESDRTTSNQTFLLSTELEGNLDVRLTRESGEPIVRARILLFDKARGTPMILSPARRMTWKRAPGIFPRYGVPPGRYKLKALPPIAPTTEFSFPPLSGWVEVERDGLAIELVAKAARVEVEPRGAGLSPDTPYQLQVWEEDGFVVLDDLRQNRVRFGDPLELNLGVGSFTLQLHGPGCASAEIPFSLPSNSRLEVELHPLGE